MEELTLDGNAAAGILGEVFGREMTTARGVCDGCGAVGQVGAARLYRTAGIVLRCPHCDAVLLKLVVARERVWLDCRGLRTLQLG